MYPRITKKCQKTIKNLTDASNKFSNLKVLETKAIAVNKKWRPNPVTNPSLYLLVWQITIFVYNTIDVMIVTY